MNRHCARLTPLLLALVAAAATPAVASATVTELGELPEGVRGSCPSAVGTVVPVPADQRCQAVTRTTGYQAKVGPERNLYRAPADGRIVAWTVALGKPGPKQTAFFQDRYGERSQVAIVVLDPLKKLSRRVVAKGPLTTMNPYFGSTVQLALETTLPIKKGQYVAVTVATWAPLLQVGLGTDTSWRSSRAADGCSDLLLQSALLGNRTESGFPCLYRGARLTYSATFINTPPEPTKG